MEAIRKQFAADWPRPIHQSEHSRLISSTLFSIDGIRFCKWFAESQANLPELMERVKTKRDTLNHIIYSNSRGMQTSHILSGFSIFAQYVHWCDASQESNYALNHPRKAKLFLEHRLADSEKTWEERTEKRMKNISDNLAKTLYNSYKIAIPHLNLLIEWQGYYFDLHACEEIEAIRRKLLHMFKTAKVSKCDSAATSALHVKRLHDAELHTMIENMWLGKGIADTYKTPKGAEQAHMKALLAALLNNSMGRRGGDVRNIDLRTLFLYHLKPVGPCPCYVVGISLRDVKEDDILYDKEHLFGLIRNRIRTHCAVSALAAYLVWLNDLSGEINLLHSIREDLEAAMACHPKPHPPSWYKLPLIQGRSKIAPMSSSHHRTLTRVGFAAGDIESKTAVTHIFRPTVLGKLLESGVSSTDAALYQGWVHGVWADTYAKGSFKTKPMLRANEWEPKLTKFFCWWEGMDADIPTELKSLVFPGLDDLYELANRAFTKYQIDKSALEFVRVLQYLRKVFLEDSLNHVSKYPEFPAYRHPAIQSPLWLAYKCAEESRIQLRETQWKVQQENPAVVSFIEDQTQKNNAFQQSLVELITKNIGSAAQIRPSASVKNRDRHPDATESHEPHKQYMVPDAHPQSLLITYRCWDESPIKAYLAEHGKIEWSKLFPADKIEAMKGRYHKLKPFWNYVDETCAALEVTPDTICNKLDAIREKYEVEPSVFLKQCFYYLFHPCRPDAKKPPPIPTRTLIEEMQAQGLPIKGNSPK